MRKYGTAIGAGRRRPLPAAVVGREVRIDELLLEVALPRALVDQQMFGEEGSDDHSQTVVHPAGLVQLRHRGVDDRVTGFSGCPRVPVLFVVAPVDAFCGLR